MFDPTILGMPENFSGKFLNPFTSWVSERILETVLIPDSIAKNHKPIQFKSLEFTNRNLASLKLSSNSLVIFRASLKNYSERIGNGSDKPDPHRAITPTGGSFRISA